MKKYLIFFKLWGSYFGLLIGLIAALQIENNRLFLLEGVRSFYFKTPIGEFSSSNLIGLGIFLFLLAGFIIGGSVHKKHLER